MYRNCWRLTSQACLRTPLDGGNSVSRFLRISHSLFLAHRNGAIPFALSEEIFDHAFCLVQMTVMFDLHQARHLAGNDGLAVRLSSWLAHLTSQPRDNQLA